MLKLVEKSVGPNIKGDFNISSCAKVAEGRWICHPDKGDNIIKFVYSFGILSISMAQRELDLDSNMQMIAVDDELSNKSIKLKDILDVLEWKCDDYLD
jgi:hypothetical protein